MKEWIYGRRPVVEHLRLLPQTAEKLLIAEGAKHDAELFELASKISLKIEKVPKQKLDQLAQGGNHQGVGLLTAGYEYAEEEEIREKVARKEGIPLVIALDCVQDPRNLGAVLRVADGAGAAGVIIPKDRAAGLTAAAARSSAGAIASVKVARVTNLARTLDLYKKEGYTIIGAAADAEEDLFAGKYFFPVVLVLGSEGEGLRPNVAARLDKKFRLPMEGKVSSLNISVAAGVFAYEIHRRARAEK